MSKHITTLLSKAQSRLQTHRKRKQASTNIKIKQKQCGTQQTYKNNYNKPQKKAIQITNKITQSQNSQHTNIKS